MEEAVDAEEAAGGNRWTLQRQLWKKKWKLQRKVEKKLWRL